MRSFISFSLFLACSLSLSAEPVDLIIRTTKGTRVVERVDSEATFWGFVDSARQEYQVESVENLDVLPNLDAMEIINVRGVKDYSFLAKSKSLRTLHMASCTVRSLKFIEKLTKLEYLNLDISIRPEDIEHIRATEIDLGNLTNLKFIVFAPFPYIGVPKFINIVSRPYISLSNSGIETVDAAEMELLRQYSLIDFLFTPLAGKILEIRKLDGLPARFFQSTDLPDEVKKYYHGEY